MYKYAKTDVKHELTINKSRFIAHLYTVTKVEEVSNILLRLKTQHPKANHCCFAYLIAENRFQKYSDDGEPNKTAGFPMIDVLTKNSMDDCLAVVIRYFGGIKLGAGGLTRAYRQATVEVLKETELVEKTVVNLYNIIVEYNLSDTLQNLLSNKAFITAIDYQEKVKFTFYTFNCSLLNEIRDLCNGISPLVIDNIKVVKP